MRVLTPETAPVSGRVAVLVPRWTDRSQVEPGVPFRRPTWPGNSKVAWQRSSG